MTYQTRVHVQLSWSARLAQFCFSFFFFIFIAILFLLLGLSLITINLYASGQSFSSCLLLACSSPLINWWWRDDTVPRNVIYSSEGNGWLVGLVCRSLWKGSEHRIVYCLGLLSPSDAAPKKPSSIMKTLQRRLKSEYNGNCDSLCLVISSSLHRWNGRNSRRLRKTHPKRNDQNIVSPLCIRRKINKLPFSAFSRSDRNWVRHQELEDPSNLIRKNEKRRRNASHEVARLKNESWIACNVLKEVNETEAGACESLKQENPL